MCLIFIAYGCLPKHRLLVAANRDEFHARPTKQAHFWDTDAILAGRDIEGGGTWMGVTRQGRFAALTNFREASTPPPPPPSRGALVVNFLSTGQSGYDYLEGLRATARQYNGFSLIVADENEMLFFSNKDCAIREIPPGVHGLSNHLLNEPWPKVTTGVRKIERMATSECVDPEALFVMLRDRDSASENSSTGPDRLRSSTFIFGGIYGTRSSSVINISHDGTLYFEERSFDARAHEIARRVYHLPHEGMTTL